MRSVESNSPADKQRIRETVWSQLEESGEALFPAARGRIVPGLADLELR